MDPSALVTELTWDEAVQTFREPAEKSARRNKVPFAVVIHSTQANVFNNGARGYEVSREKI